MARSPQDVINEIETLTELARIIVEAKGLVPQIRGRNTAVIELCLYAIAVEVVGKLGRLARPEGANGGGES